MKLIFSILYYFNIYKKEDSLLCDFASLKHKRKFIVYDSHIHPQEVLGIRPQMVVCGDNNHLASISPTLLERFDFNIFSLNILEKLFFYFPSYISRTIQFSFLKENEDFLLKGMNDANVDKGVLVPVSPYSTSESLSKKFSSSRFIMLGSVDIHEIDILEIEAEITTQIREHSIVGIKLHPNIQKFYPLPEDNDKVIAEKLRHIYFLVNKYKIYILFHAGVSYLPNKNSFSKADYGILENFFNKRGGGKNVFEYISTPIVLAHMGSYNVKKPRFDLLGKIVDEYKHVYFDTSGVNSDYISRFGEKYGFDQVIFGSDSPYFNLRYTVFRVLSAIIKKSSVQSSEEKIIKVFSGNYEKIITALRQEVNIN